MLYEIRLEFEKEDLSFDQKHNLIFNINHTEWVACLLKIMTNDLMYSNFSEDVRKIFKQEGFCDSDLKFFIVFDPIYKWNSEEVDKLWRDCREVATVFERLAGCFERHTPCADFLIDRIFSGDICSDSDSLRNWAQQTYDFYDLERGDDYYLYVAASLKKISQGFRYCDTLNKGRILIRTFPDPLEFARHLFRNL